MIFLPISKIVYYIIVYIKILRKGKYKTLENKNILLSL